MNPLDPPDLNQAAKNALTLAGYSWHRSSRPTHRFLVFIGTWRDGEALGYVNFDITPDEINRRIAEWQGGKRDAR